MSMDIIIDDKIDAVHASIRHGFFGREGGVSEGIYKSLNCGVGSDDNPDAVAENRKRVVESLVDKNVPLVTVNQVHSPDCVIIEQPFKNNTRPNADALVTDRAGLVLGILTADCGCILFVGTKPDGSPVIGGAHAGWKGAVGGVLQSTVQKMLALGAELSSIQASIGPCIGPKSYEVSQGFEQPFLDQNDENERFFMSARKEGHLMFDLPGYIASQLAQAGVSNITITGHDTFAEMNRFFSYRRATHAKEPDYGRQISAIMIAE